MDRWERCLCDFEGALPARLQFRMQQPVSADWHNEAKKINLFKGGRQELARRGRRSGNRPAPQRHGLCSDERLRFEHSKPLAALLASKEINNRKLISRQTKPKCAMISKTAVLAGERTPKT
jgi:hypothetical protein